MTSQPDRYRRRHGAAGARDGLWRAEIIDTLRLSWPMALTQLGQIAMMTTDLMLLGRLGDQVVAATALAHTVLFAAFCVGMGLVSAVAPLASQAYGARQPRIVRRALRVGLWAALMIGVPLTAPAAVGPRHPDRCSARRRRPRRSPAAISMGLGWSLVPAWAFLALRNFMGAVNRPEPALWITLAAIPANLVLAYALIYGAFGLPELGPAGRRHRHDARQRRHVRGGDLGLLRAPPVQEVSRARPLLAPGLAVVCQAAARSARRSRARSCSSSACSRLRPC